MTASYRAPGIDPRTCQHRVFHSRLMPAGQTAVFAINQHHVCSCVVSCITGAYTGRWAVVAAAHQVRSMCPVLAL